MADVTALNREESPHPHPPPPRLGEGGGGTLPTEPTPDPARLAAALQRLSEIGGDGRASVSRLAFTPEEREAHRVMGEWMRAAGLSVREDAFGNTIGERPGTGGARPDSVSDGELGFLAFGSHLDSVPNGGRFDGIVGVVGALEIVRMLADAGITTRHPLRMVAFANEEGARFGEACLGSKAVAGVLGPRDTDRLVDASGTTLAQAMRRLGMDPRRIEDVRWADGEVAAFLELHIEQGRQLEAQGLAIGVVDAVAGNTRVRVRVRGRADHSGGTPMSWRKDALAASAEIIVGVEAVANEPSRRATVATVGRLDVSPNSITTVPGSVEFYVDVRDLDSDRQRDTAQRVVQLCEQVCARRGLELGYEVVSDTSPSVLPLWLRRITQEVCRELGLAHRVMASGAGHDAQILARRMPAAMLFVPSHDGASHVPEEWTSVDDIAAGVRALYATLLRLDRFLSEDIA